MIRIIWVTMWVMWKWPFLTILGYFWPFSGYLIEDPNQIWPQITQLLFVRSNSMTLTTYLIIFCQFSKSFKFDLFWPIFVPIKNKVKPLLIDYMAEFFFVTFYALNKIILGLWTNFSMFSKIKYKFSTFVPFWGISGSFQGI